MTSDLSFKGRESDVPLSIVQSPRARRMRLRVDQRTGAVLLTMPRRVSRRHALEWAAGHRDWVEAQLASINPATSLVPGASLPFEGVPHVIDWQPSRSRLVALEGGRLRIGGPLENVEARILRWLKREAARILDSETRVFALKAGVTVGRTGVGDPVSRWGSCSSSGAIRYSWRLILAPDWVRRATVAHEVAHRVHMDHSLRFHALVEKLLGDDPRPARLWLRRHGASLHRFGGRG